MKLKRLALVAAGCLAACAGNSNPGSGGGGGNDAPGQGDALATTSGGQQSGSRIKIVNITTADGLVVASPYQFHDTQLNIDCSFGTASDGLTRCLPSKAMIDEVYYSDAACTMPLAVTATCPQGQSAPPYILLYTAAATCPGSTTAAVYNTGPSFSGPTYYAKSGANCIAETTTAALSYYTVTGPAIAPSTYAEATLAVSN